MDTWTRFDPYEHIDEPLLRELLTLFAKADAPPAPRVYDLLPKLTPTAHAALAVSFVIAGCTAQVIRQLGPEVPEGGFYGLQVVALADESDPEVAADVAAAQIVSQAIGARLNGDNQDAITILGVPMQRMETGLPVLLTQLRIWGWICDGRNIHVHVGRE